MIKIFFILISHLLLINNLVANSLDNKIKSNKTILNSQATKKLRTTLKIKELADKIENQNKNLSKLEKDIEIINSNIEEQKDLLEQSKLRLSFLNVKSSKLMKERKSSEEQIVDTIIDDFSISLALKLASKDHLQELIDSEVYTILSQNSKDKILRLNNSYDLVTSNTKENKSNIKKISSYIKKQERTKKTLNSLKRKHSSSLNRLESEHKRYQKELKKVIAQQESLKNLLAKLNILKKEEIRKEEEKRKRLQALLAKKRKAKQKTNTKLTRNEQFAKDLDLDVRKIGSSTSGVKITKYRGAKTIAPLKSFKVVKKFGTYYDPVYKIKLFNESVVLKTNRPKAKVVSVLNGKVVYAKKDAGMLENVVIVQHRNGLHTIYSHLDEISPTIKVGKWIKKGYVVGRVDNNLTFQATKNSYHINPKDLFRI